MRYARVCTLALTQCLAETPIDTVMCIKITVTDPGALFLKSWEKLSYAKVTLRDL